MDSKGKIREWSISVGKDKRGHYYEITHGQKDGAMQNARTYVLKGKNIGRANETTAEEQCLSEAKSEHTKQIERKGYTESIPTTQPLKPMLAKKYEDEKDKVIYPCAVQPKLDGCISGSTLIKTKKCGYRTIKDIVENKLDVEVASLNTKNKRIEYKKVLNYFINRKIDSKIQWYELETESGEKIKITGNHQVYLPELKCWRRVDELDGNESLMLI